MEDNYKQEDNLLTLDQIQQFEFLYAQPQYLVLKIKTTFKNLLEQEHPFCGWIIKKINLKNHYLMMSQGKIPKTVSLSSITQKQHPINLEVLLKIHLSKPKYVRSLPSCFDP